MEISDLPKFYETHSIDDYLELKWPSGAARLELEVSARSGLLDVLRLMDGTPRDDSFWDKSNRQVTIYKAEKFIDQKLDPLDPAGLWANLGLALLHSRDNLGVPYLLSLQKICEIDPLEVATLGRNLAYGSGGNVSPHLQQFFEATGGPGVVADTIHSALSANDLHLALWLHRNHPPPTSEPKDRPFKTPPDCMALVHLLTTEQGGRTGFANDLYRPQHRMLPSLDSSGQNHFLDRLEVQPGSSSRSALKFLSPEQYPKSLWLGHRLEIREGNRIVGIATVLEIFNETLSRQLSDPNPFLSSYPKSGSSTCKACGKPVPSPTLKKEDRSLVYSCHSAGASVFASDLVQVRGKVDLELAGNLIEHLPPHRGACPHCKQPLWDDSSTECTSCRAMAVRWDQPISVSD